MSAICMYIYSAPNSLQSSSISISGAPSTIRHLAILPLAIFSALHLRQIHLRSKCIIALLYCCIVALLHCCFVVQCPDSGQRYNCWLVLYSTSLCVMLVQLRVLAGLKRPPDCSPAGCRKRSLWPPTEASPQQPQMQPCAAGLDDGGAKARLSRGLREAVREARELARRVQLSVLQAAMAGL